MIQGVSFSLKLLIKSEMFLKNINTKITGDVLMNEKKKKKRNFVILN